MTCPRAMLTRRARRHQPDPALVEQAFRLRCQRAAEHEGVGVGQQFVERVYRPNPGGRDSRRLRSRVGGTGYAADLGAKSGEDLADLSPYLPRPTTVTRRPASCRVV